MGTKNVTTQELKKTLSLYLSRWKLIAFFVIVALALAYSFLRYSTYQYDASATIRIKTDQESQKLPSLTELNGGSALVNNNANDIQDEIEIITSRNLIEKIVKKLNLNITYYKQGKIKELEIYENPPIKINFFAHDSIIHKVDTTLFIKIKSESEFLMFKDDGKSLVDRDESQGQSYSFGDRISTGFGNIIIVPNSGQYKPNIGSNLRVSIKPTSAVVRKHLSKLSVSNADGSNIVKLRLEDNIPKRAIDILNHIIEEYNNDIMIDREDVVKITSDFINNRLELVFKELEEVDFTAEQLQKRNNLTALGSQTDIYLQSERQIESEINNTSNTIQIIDYVQQELEKNDSDLLPIDIGLPDGNINQISRSHNELVVERDKFLKNSSESHPVVINLNNQINALKESLSSSLENMKRTSNITLSNLNREDNRIRSQIYSAPTKQRQLRDIERQQSIKESLYLYLLEKREESAITHGMFTPSAKVIDKAYSSRIPISPNKMLIYLASMIIGFIIPVGYIYLKDLLDTKIYDKNDLLEVLNVPYIGDIPLTNKKHKLINKIDYSPKAEAFRILRSNIDFLLKNKNHKTKKIFVTSTGAQEGKSHTSTNLATSISFSEKSVLLIEMDIRVPKIMKYLNEKNTTDIGLSDFIINKSIKPNEIVNKITSNPHLHVIPSGTIPPNPSELLMSDRVEELFNYFDDKYDYIIVDTSAVGLVSDTLLVSKFADMFIYVVSANNVDKRQLVAVAKPLYDDNRLPNMNMLLNGTNYSKKGYGYGYGYGKNPQKKKKWYNFSS